MCVFVRSVVFALKQDEVKKFSCVLCQSFGLDGRLCKMNGRICLRSAGKTKHLISQNGL